MSTSEPAQPIVQFVVRSGPEIGLGHVARCAALADALRRQGADTVLRLLEGSVPTDLIRRFDHVAGSQQLSVPPADLTVLDVPKGDPIDLAQLGQVVVVHDGPPQRVDADVVVNPNLAAISAGYRVRSRGSALAGARYALLDPTVRQARDHYSCPDREVRRMVITCGAADPAGVSEIAMRALAPMASELEIVVLVGPLNPRGSAIDALARSAGMRAVHGASVISEVLDAQLSVTTLGVTASELACLGVPNLAIAHSAEQLPHLMAYEARGLVHAIGEVSEVADADIAVAVRLVAGSPVRRRELYRRSRRVVDGLGADRVARRLLDRLAR